MAQVEANGVTLDVEDNGDRSAPALLLIMGLGMPAALWPDGFVERLLASGLRVIRFDNRDCGHSTRLRSAVSTRNRIVSNVATESSTAMTLASGSQRYSPFPTPRRASSS